MRYDVSISSGRVVCSLLLAALSIARPGYAHPVGQTCATNGGFYSDPQVFQSHLAQLGLLQTAAWNFTPNDLPLNSSVALNDGLNLITHASNANDPWTNNGGQDLWPAALNNIQFSSSTTPGGPLTPRGAGGLTFSTPGGSSLLSATVPADSLNIVCGSPIDRSCQALGLYLEGPGFFLLRV